MTTLDVDLFLPEPAPREVAYTVISVDDHVVEPPHLFDAPTCRPRCGRTGPQIVEDANGAQVWEFEGEIYSQVGMNAVAGRRPDTVQGRAVPLRAHAARVLRRRRPHRRHGRRRDLGDAQLPVADHRLLRAGVLLRPQRRGRSGGRPGVERLAPRGVVPAPPRAHHPVRDRLPHRPRRGGRARSNATPSGGSAASPCPNVRTPSACRRCGTATTGARSSRACLRDRHRDLAPRRQLGRLPRPARRAGLQIGSTMFGQLSLGACAEWLWSELPARAPRPEDRHERGWHRLGPDADRPARQHGRPLRLRPGVGRAAGRRAAPELLVLHHRRSVDHRPPPRHRRRSHHGRDRLPARRRHVARHPGGDRRPVGRHSRPTSCAACAASTPPSCTATRCPTSCCPSDRDAGSPRVLGTVWPRSGGDEGAWGGAGETAELAGQVGLVGVPAFGGDAGPALLVVEVPPHRRQAHEPGRHAGGPPRSAA